MVLQLRGRPLPPLPTVPGRVHTLATAADAFTADDREALLASGASLGEIGLALGVSRQRVHQLRQALRERQAEGNA